MEKREMLYEGKAKKVYATDQPDHVIVSYKDDATAFNGQKKGTIVGKGVINNKMSNVVFAYLAQNGIETDFVEELNDRETVLKKVTIIPLEVVVRNVAAGSFSKRFGVAEGSALLNPIVEFSYKNDDLGDPQINDLQAMALGLATKAELDLLREKALTVDKLLQDYFLKLGIELVDFKLEFGRFGDQILLADECSPDTCRLWDSTTHEKLDKDRFRRDMGGVEDAYQEVWRRITEAMAKEQ